MRVVEIASGRDGLAVPYAGWLLAEMGADVSRAVRAADASGAASNGSGVSPLALAQEALAHGKRPVAMPGTAADLAQLVDACDVLLVDDPDTIAALGLDVRDAARVQARFPGVVIGVATIFGLDGPYASNAATELDAQALSAVSWSLGESGREPLSLPPGVAAHQAGAMLAAGVLAADNRAATIVDVALADVLASYVAGNCRLYIHHGLKWARSGRRASGSGGAYPYVILPCADGAVCLCGRTRDEWQRFVSAMGNPVWASEPRYRSLRAMGTQYPEEVDALVLPWLAKHTKAELETIALENNLIVSPIRMFDEVLSTPQLAERGFLRDEIVAGRAVRAPGLPFRVGVGRRADEPDIAATLLQDATTQGTATQVTPTPGTATRATATHAASLVNATPSSTNASARGPLSGLRVLDFGWVWSAPWVGTILGELGAEVIKVEHALRPDNLRLSGKVFRNGVLVEGPTTEMSPMFHQVNHDKLGITLNTKMPRAVELAKQLVARSDIVIENMSPGSMDRVGLGYETLRAINPKLVMLAMSAAGQFGPQSAMRAYAPTMSSFVGLEALLGYRGEAPIGALNFGLGDPNASAHGLVAVLAALRRVASTGAGCYIDLSQVEALLSTLRPYLLAAQVEDRQPLPLGNAHPDYAPHGIYPSAGSDQWLTIAVADDKSWQALQQVSGNAEFAHDERFATADARIAHRDVLDAGIARWTSQHDRDALVARLRATGIAASPVLSVEELWVDPHYAARGIKTAVDIPVYGSEDLFRAPLRFSGFIPRVERRGPSLGEHNRDVFGTMLGLPDDEIESLQKSGVIA